jgi:hypothetical protein
MKRLGLTSANLEPIMPGQTVSHFGTADRALPNYNGLDGKPRFASLCSQLASRRHRTVLRFWSLRAMLTTAMSMLCGDAHGHDKRGTRPPGLLARAD